MHFTEQSTQNQCKNIRFVRYGDFVLLNETSLVKLGIDKCQLVDNSPEAEVLVDKLKKRFKCHRVAVKGSIQNDNFRTPTVTILGRNQDPWVLTVDNRIKYSFNIYSSMFSKGNIKEKLRLSRLDCTDETVVDLFAGIGYFSLVFAVHCKARHVYCCEWNPDAVEALRRNVVLNRVEERVTICPGDNRVTCPVDVAHRVNMGLIPTSLASLDVACRALQLISHRPLYLHVHENLNYVEQQIDDETLGNSACLEKKRSIWAQRIVSKVQENLSQIQPTLTFRVESVEINCIKAYAPHIDHMVLDVLIQRVS